MSVEDRYRAMEDEAEARRLRKIRRQPVILLALINVLTLAVAATAVIDLRRLATPQGTALAWTEAALFGQCDSYAELSVADPARPERRSSRKRCEALRVATATARQDVARIALNPVGTHVTGGQALASVRLRRSTGDAVVIALDLTRTHGHWRVVRSARTCRVLACP